MNPYPFNNNNEQQLHFQALQQQQQQIQQQQAHFYNQQQILMMQQQQQHYQSPQVPNFAHQQSSAFPRNTYETKSLTLSSGTAVDRFGFLGGEQFTEEQAEDKKQVDGETIRKREKKWLKMLNVWDTTMSKQFNLVRKRARKGVPFAIRPRVWQFLSGSRYMLVKHENLYQKLIQSHLNEEIGEEIKKDISRQYPQHEDFASGHSQPGLFNILKAYCILNSKVGYCQAHAPIAAAFLLHMPEEEAFWTFYQVCNVYMACYYDAGLDKVKIDAQILMRLLKKHFSSIHNHLLKHDIIPLHFMVDWFMCLFTRNFPWVTVLRLFDQFFCEGIKVLFRFALAVLYCVLGHPDQRKALNSMEATLQQLRNIPHAISCETNIVPMSLKFCNIVTEAELKRMYEKVMTHSM